MWLFALPIACALQGWIVGSWLGAALAFVIGIATATIIYLARRNRAALRLPLATTLPPWSKSPLLLLLIAPWLYGVIITFLHIVNPALVVWWITPFALPTEMILPNAAVIRVGHDANGHPIYGLVNAHLLAAGLFFAVVFWLLATYAVLKRPSLVSASLRAMTYDADRGLEQWLLRSAIYFVFSLATASYLLWILVLHTEILSPSGRFAGRESIFYMPGIHLVLLTQFLAFSGGGASLVVAAWIGALSDPTSAEPGSR